MLHQYRPISDKWTSFVTSENTRKPLVLRCFQGVQNGNISQKWDLTLNLPLGIYQNHLLQGQCRSNSLIKPNWQIPNHKFEKCKISFTTFVVCGEHIITSSPGTIHMPYGDDYHNNQTCIWIIEFPPGKQITVDVRRLNLEAGTLSCLYDYLEIRDGKDKNAPLFGKFCGTSRPPKFHSSSNFVYIKFVSDAAFTRDGFVLEYMEGPPGENNYHLYHFLNLQ